VSDNEDEDDVKQELGWKTTEQSTKIDGTTKYEDTGTNTPIVKTKHAERTQFKGLSYNSVICCHCCVVAEI
jgi:hypothetical protein